MKKSRYRGLYRLGANNFHPHLTRIYDEKLLDHDFSSGGAVSSSASVITGAGSSHKTCFKEKPRSQEKLHQIGHKNLKILYWIREKKRTYLIGFFF